MEITLKISVYRCVLGSPGPSDVCKHRSVCGCLLSITIWSCLRVGQLSASSVSCLILVSSLQLTSQKETIVPAKKNMRFFLKIEGLVQECPEGELSMMKTRKVAQNREGTLLINLKNASLCLENTSNLGLGGGGG